MNVIIGIDPGTTTAYAAFDTSGKLVRAYSGRFLSLEELLKRTSDLDIIGVATDKKEVPQLIRRFAAARGARIFSPPEDLSVEEKKGMLSELENLNLENIHQKDAAAAAVWALRSIGGLLAKLERADEKENLSPDEMKNVEKRVILLGKNIASAIREVRAAQEYQQKETFEKEQKPKKEDQKVGYAHGNIVNSPASEVEKTILLLSKQNRWLKREVKRLLRKVKKLKSERQTKEFDFQKKLDQMLRFKEERIQLLSRRVSELERKLLEIEELNKRITEIALNSEKFEIIPKIRSLNPEERELNEAIRARFIFVENPEIISQKTVQILRREGKVLISSRRFPKQVSSELVTLEAGALGLKDLGTFMTGDRDVLKREADSHRALERILEEYKRERNKKQ